MRPSLVLVPVLSLLLASTAHAELVQRPSPTAGSVVDLKTGEEIAFVDSEGWHGVEVTQAVLSGDTLRTNALGQLAILFADQTQVRVGRNTTLVVKAVGPDGARLEMPAGAIWARAARGGSGVTIDTPAAAAAIRGTDWSLTVGPDGRTTLVVLEGAVDLTNPLGSVTVRQGEAATAAIGQAPSKIAVVDVKDREQMLLYISLRSAFTFLPATTLPSRDVVREAARLKAIPVERMGAEDLVARAEIALALDTPAEAERAVADARRTRLSRGQEARLDLVAALIAGERARYAEAADLFARARPGLDPSRRGVAEYGAYFARALADPKLAEAAPRLDPAAGPYAMLAEAFTAGYRDGPRAALEIIRKAEARFPDEAVLVAARAQFARLAGDRDEMASAVEHAVALDPDNPIVLGVRADYRSEIESDLLGAEADLKRAIELQPGDSGLWNDLGNLYRERDLYQAAEAAFTRAIELEPEDPIAYTNRALLYILQNRIADAEADIAAARQRDPELSVIGLVEGQVQLMKGDNPGAIQSLLRSSAANPTLSAALLLLAAAYIQNGENEPADQALDNAARLDPEEPTVPVVRAAIAIDRYEAEAAIESARDALELMRARGGYYASIGASRESGSIVGSAFRFIGLEAWGRAYSDLLFDPFNGASFIDQSIAATADPFAIETTYGRENPVETGGPQAFSSLMQGLLLDPLTIATPEKRLHVFPTPFIEAEASGGWAFGDGSGPAATAQVQGFTYSPFPVSGLVAANIRRFDQDGSTLFDDPITGTVILGATPTLEDRAVLIANYADSSGGFTGNVLSGDPASEETDTKGGQVSLGWSHSFGDRNILSAAVLGARADIDSNLTRGTTTLGTIEENSSNRESYLAALGHTLGLSETVTLRTGVEVGRVEIDDITRRALLLFGGVFLLPTEVQGGRTDFLRSYADIHAKVTDTLTIEGAIAGSMLRSDQEGGDHASFEPRIGAAWSIFEGHTIRAALMRETLIPSSLTLGPVGVVGLQSAIAPLEAGADVDTIALRWDAEWTPRFFTSLEVRRQFLETVSIDVPSVASSIDLDEATIDRVSFTANAALGYGFGAFGTVAYTPSDGEADGVSGDVPYVPEWTGQVGLAFVHPSRIHAKIAATYVGERDGSFNAQTLGSYVTLDGNVGWESPDRSFELDLSVYNLLDDDFEVAPDIPGWGRTVVGTATVRF